MKFQLSTLLCLFSLAILAVAVQTSQALPFPSVLSKVGIYSENAGFYVTAEGQALSATGSEPTVTTDTCVNFEQVSSILTGTFKLKASCLTNRYLGIDENGRPALLTQQDVDNITFMSGTEDALKIVRNGQNCYVAFKDDGSPVDNGCSEAAEGTPVEVLPLSNK